MSSMFFSDALMLQRVHRDLYGRVGGHCLSNVNCALVCISPGGELIQSW